MINRRQLGMTQRLGHPSGRDLNAVTITKVGRKKRKRNKGLLWGRKKENREFNIELETFKTLPEEARKGRAK